MALEITLPTDREIRIVRELAAPRQLVWDCHTKPELLRRWMNGYDGWTMPVCIVDLRVGGRYRYVWKNETDGRQFGSHGKHLEISPVGKLVTTEEMDGLGPEPMDIENPVEGPDPAVNTLVLTEANGRTTLTLNLLYGSREVRDMALQSGMTDGMETCYARIEALAAEAAA